MDKQEISLAMIFIKLQSSSWGRTVEAPVLGILRASLGKARDRTAGLGPRWQEDECEALTVLSVSLFYDPYKRDWCWQHPGGVSMTQLSRHCLQLKASESRNEKQVEGGGEPSRGAHLQPSLAKRAETTAADHRGKEEGEAMTEGAAGHLPPRRQQGCKPFSMPYVVRKKSLVRVNVLLQARSVRPVW